VAATKRRPRPQVRRKQNAVGGGLSGGKVPVSVSRFLVEWDGGTTCAENGRLPRFHMGWGYSELFMSTCQLGILHGPKAKGTFPPAFWKLTPV
jgi:hypothetical protein